MLTAILIAAASALAAPAQPLYVPLLDVDPEEVAAEAGGAPIAWSAVGPYTVGQDYALQRGAGQGALLCTVRSFDIREGSGQAPQPEVWATLACPIDALSAL